ncbi:hypothetical protein [Bradyrhizobium pachyrhizi]|uniref:hypothetical protein n=1 Tax=Bradyrhizobium pachyrhizi TaxID=280333 RepID=UPI003D36AF26
MTSQNFGKVLETLRRGLSRQLEALQRNLAQYPPIDHPMDASQYETLSRVWAASEQSASRPTSRSQIEA